METTTREPSRQAFFEEWKDILAPTGFGYRVRILSQLMSRRFQDRLEPFGITPFHWVVLCCLWQEDGLPTSAICERLQQVGGTLTGVLDRMEERGLVRRERDSRDRRIWRVFLTEQGEELMDELPPVVRRVKEETLAGIAEEERALLSRLLDRTIANLAN
ncbi:MarR family winged helix-turn-helix transcriptional regulator [Gloeobacter kilaueensis]|uniref:MarR family transcriptional regulator n=1 Tax=Gloeobacter kilaueensis (strain ATCC BAA-2537 / CCAP 1431/1 / ULC 316 / JS1) TaxID=1183438 RepID=U5QP89_GLOK1|nr:MarR family winged helix-turn-helix transcriptional regulator [Gloeobacter kilaueensis]AGY60713.1 MarR family transcriptional regulator [Gloeobacter kilaueensis JS1]